MPFTTVHNLAGTVLRSAGIRTTGSLPIVLSVVIVCFHVRMLVLIRGTFPVSVGFHLKRVLLCRPQYRSPMTLHMLHSQALYCSSEIWRFVETRETRRGR